jgi:hypothetical protein
VAQQLAKLHLEFQHLQSRLQTSTKDLSLVSLVPKWAGTTNSSPLHEFFESIESASRIGNWSGDDMVRIATLKLTDTARLFFNASPALHSPDVTWEALKAAFLDRFRDPRTDQFHFSQLQSAKQRRGEAHQDFADRCRRLAQNITPQVADPTAQRLYNEQADRFLLASYVSGLIGTPGTQVRYALPRTLKEAIKIAVTVEQAELQVRKGDAFYLDSEEMEPRYSRTFTRGPRGENRGRYSSHRKSHTGDRQRGALSYTEEQR